MEVYPETWTVHFKSFAYDDVYCPFFEVYLHPPKKYYSHSLNLPREAMYIIFALILVPSCSVHLIRQLKVFVRKYDVLLPHGAKG